MEKIEISPAQAGGQGGKATSDHLIIINSLIKEKKKQRKNNNLYLAFLDVTKAYDKAWIDAIIYTAHQSGVKG